MKKNIKAVIACAAVLVVAGGGYAALMLTDNGIDTSSSDTSGEPIAVKPETILNIEKSDIVSVNVSNASGGYEGVPTGNTADDGLPEFTVKGIEDLDVNDTITRSLLNSSSTLDCDSVVTENADDISKYGLESPQAEVTIKTASEEKKLLIGNESPESGETYCMMDGEKTVYLAGTSAVSVFMNSKENFLSNTLIEAASDGNNPIPEKITISRTDLDYNIVLEEYTYKSDSGNTSGTLATHIMTEPVFSYLDVEKSQDATQGFFGLSAYTALYAHPEEEQIKASGLDKPFCTVTTKIKDGESYTIKIGNQLQISEGTFYSVMINDVDVIYAVSADSLCWATITPGDITSRMIFGTYVWDIARLEIDVNGGEKVEFIGSGTDDDYQVTKNGDKCNSERFRTFYTFLLKTSAEDFVIDEKPEGEPTVTVALETQDGKTSQTVEFYKAEGKKSLIVVNGTPCFKCRTSYVDLLVKNLSIFDTNEDFVMNW